MQNLHSACHYNNALAFIKLTTSRHVVSYINNRAGIAVS
jgi:hypothetical protein